MIIMEIPKKIMEEFEKYCKREGIEGRQKEEKLELLRQRLERYKYEPGEAIGVIAAQSISEPATQMCTAYDERVVLKFRNKIKIFKIGEIVDRAVEENHVKINGYEIFDVPSDTELLTPSLSATGHAEWKKITALCRCNSPPHLLEVRTRSGRSVKATDSHSFVMKQDNKIVSISGKNLKLGDELPIIEYLPDKPANDVLWDKIIEIKKVESPNAYVYDMTVEGNHTFALVNGLVIHNTMRSYTLASQSDRLSKVTQGLPRLIEIFDARKTFEKNMTIYLKEQHNDKAKAKELATQIKESKLADIIIFDSIDLVNMAIEFELEKEDYKDVVKASIEKSAKDAEVKFHGRKIMIKPKASDVKSLRKLKNKLLKLHVAGVKSIENVVMIKEGDDWIIQTTGTNLKKILRLDFVDVARTKTNDIHQVYEVLGIEAARNAILHEAKDTLDEQGLDVDVRHLMLLADMMTFDGTIRDIGRYGVSGKKASVLARANFEETKKHLINASFYGETDRLEGIIENILVGQLPPIGTGIVKLTVDAEKLKLMVKKK